MLKTTIRWFNGAMLAGLACATYGSPAAGAPEGVNTQKNGAVVAGYQPPDGPPAYRTNPLPRGAAPSLPPDAQVPLVLREDQLLSHELELWAKRQNLRLLWQSKKDYVIYSSIVLKGHQRDDVLNELAALLRSENYGLVIRLYEGNHVLLIDDQ